MDDGSIFEGQIENGIPEGKGLLIKKDIGISYEGFFVKGKFIKGTTRYLNDIFRQFLLSHPHPSDVEKFLSDPRNLAFEGELKEYKIVNGIGTVYYPNLGIYHGTIVNGLKSGTGKAWKINGDFYEGQWKDDLFDGKGKLLIKNIKTGNFNSLEGEWEDGIHQAFNINYAKWLQQS